MREALYETTSAQHGTHGRRAQDATSPYDLCCSLQ
jgi:hypothetical protein